MNQYFPKNKIPVLTISIAAFMMLALPYCRKPDAVPILTDSRIAEDIPPRSGAAFDKFFDTTGVEDQLVLSTAEILRRQEDKQPFVKEFIKYGGFPIWSKALVKSPSANSMTYTRGQYAGNKANKPNDIVYIPFALEGDSTLNAILTVAMYPGDTTLQMQYYWQYAQNGYGEVENGNNADQTALFFMGYESFIFGHHTFLIEDKRLLEGKKASDTVRIVSFNEPVQNALMLPAGNYVVCYVTDMEHTATECTVYTNWIYVPDDIGSDGANGIIDLGITGGGGGGSGGSGSSENSSGWADNPCGTGSPTGRMAPCGIEDPPYKPLPEVVVEVETEIICQNSFHFITYVSVGNQYYSGGWQVAAIRNIHLNLISTKQPSLRVQMPTLYFGLPVIRVNGESYSYEIAQSIAANAVNKAEEVVYNSYKAGNTNLTSLGNLFLLIIENEMKKSFGTVSKQPGSGISISPKDVTDAEYPLLGLCF